MSHFGDNIIIDGSSFGHSRQRYETEVGQQLMQLLLFQTGQAVINEIWAQRRHRLRIVPWHSAAQDAQASPTSHRDATVRGAPIRSGSDGWHNPRSGHGTGRGSDSRVRYTPFILASDMSGGWSRGSRQAWFELTGQLPLGPGVERGELLLHEMVHSLQHMTGTLTNQPMGSNFQTVTEFNAVMVANVYASERARPLRANHTGYHRATNPRAFSTDPIFAGRLVEFRKSLPGLAARLARINTPFNPFSPGELNRRSRASRPHRDSAHRALSLGPNPRRLARRRLAIAMLSQNRTWHAAAQTKLRQSLPLVWDTLGRSIDHASSITGGDSREALFLLAREKPCAYPLS